MLRMVRGNLISMGLTEAMQIQLVGRVQLDALKQLVGMKIIEFGK